MRIVSRCLSALLLVAVGYVLGAGPFFTPQIVSAQAGQGVPAIDLGEEPSDENQVKIRDAYNTLKSAVTALESDNMYKSATKGVNAFSALCGGVNALDDLEAGIGVDPETFAGLYAGMGVDEVVQYLDKDDQGRLTYKGKLIRLYPISKLKQLYARRLKYSGEEKAATP